jgi:DNA-binding Xre family transcriptional regulator
MLKNEKQYRSAKTALTKWRNNLDVLQERALSGALADWQIKEERFAIEQQIKQLQAEIQEYDDIVAGITQLSAPASYVDALPTLLISWRLKKHLTQKQLAERAGIHENLLQKYESENYSSVSLHIIAKIARILQMEDSAHASSSASRRA